jgi:hypothetical protein
VDPNPHGYALILAGRIRIQVGKIGPQKIEEISGFEVLDVFLKAAGFSCSLDHPLGDLGINILHFLSKL